MSITERRGKFKVSTWMIERDFKAVLTIMAHVVVLSVEHKEGYLAYTGISEKFDIVPIGNETPRYTARLINTESGPQFDGFARA